MTSSLRLAIITLMPASAAMAGTVVDVNFFNNVGIVSVDDCHVGPVSSYIEEAYCRKTNDFTIPLFSPDPVAVWHTAYALARYNLSEVFVKVDASPGWGAGGSFAHSYAFADTSSTVLITGGSGVDTATFAMTAWFPLSAAVGIQFCYDIGSVSECSWMYGDFAVPVLFTYDVPFSFSMSARVEGFSFDPYDGSAILKLSKIQLTNPDARVLGDLAPVPETPSSILVFISLLFLGTSFFGRGSWRRLKPGEQP